MFLLSAHSNNDIISSSEPGYTDTSLFEPSCNEPVSLSEHSTCSTKNVLLSEPSYDMNCLLSEHGNNENVFFCLNLVLMRML